MIEKQVMFGLKNRSAGSVCYTVPDLNVRRSFEPGETKKVTKENVEDITEKESVCARDDISEILRAIEKDIELNQNSLNVFLEKSLRLAIRIEHIIILLLLSQ